MELAITGIEDSSCSIAPVTGVSILGTVSTTAIASTPREKTSLCLMVAMNL